jgi:hypothetical protein
MRAYDDIDQITPIIYRFVKYFSANGKLNWTEKNHLV